ncbi:beta strand repeat-containing protein [Actinoplanes sp. NPDC051494]|uniref:beta strand repeat-containing protein n=1 Tax=Actinoplanes sp. NPDC051494 TaxID=3363907 RepID=UPI0037A3AB83
MLVLRSRPKRALAVLVVLALGLTMTLYMSRAEAVITTAFGQEFGTNANGAILMRGNVNLVCPAAATGCSGAQGGTGSTSDETLNNNGYVMEATGADAGNGIINSSNATITMPANSTVLFAGLYWSANTAAGTSGAAALTEADKNKVKITVPKTAGWQTVTASRVDVTNTTIYQGFADVTSMVAGAGNGLYSVGNIQAGTGKDRYAAWSLVIAYQNASLPMRDLRVYDGFGIVSNSSTSVDITVNGFLTPPGGNVTTTIGTVVYEGDLGKTGDALKLNGTALSDARNPADNFFNSTISEGGALVTDRTPGFSNTMGLDVDQFDASNKLANSATSATLTLTTAGEIFYPGVVTFTTDLYAPDLTATLTGTDKTGDAGRLMPGDEIEYSISVNNKGSDNSVATVLTDAIPAGTTYVPGSLKIDGTAKTDAASDDTADYSSGQGKTTFRLGTGATASAGGTLTSNATTVVTYRVKVNDNTPSATVITNVASLAYNGDHTGRMLTGTSNVVTATVDKPVADLSATLTVGPTTVQRDGTPDAVVYQMSVKNNGTDREPLAVAKLTLPAGVTPDSLPAGCTQSGQDITCALGAIVGGATTTVVLNTHAGNTGPRSSVATAVASGSGTDNTAGNNTATATLIVNTPPKAVDDTVTTNTGVAKIITVLANDTDDDGDTLTVATGTAPGHGTLVVNPDKTITYTPEAAWAGSDTFTYVLSDGNNGSSTATVVVHVDNAPPVANADPASTPAGTMVPIAVLANDTDANGDPLSILSFTQPAKGSVVQNGTSLEFTPSSDLKGNATFTYTVSDGRGGTAVGTVTVTVANAGPVATNDSTTTAYLTDAVIDVLANDTDPNGDPKAIVSVTQPANGTTTITAGKITYKPAATFSGVDTFTYVMEDDEHATSTATVTVTVLNAPPTATGTAVSTNYAAPVTINWVPLTNDPNGDTLHVSGTGTPAHGTVALDGTGKIVYTPANGYSGPDSFGYTVSDGKPGGTATATITVTVANGVPVATPDVVTAQRNVPLSVAVLANDTDPNGDPLTVTVDVAPAHGTAVVQPDGTVLYTPAAGYQGADTFHYTISDGKPGGTAGATVTLAVVNSAPMAQPDAAVTPTSTPVTIAVLTNDTDPNGDLLSVIGTTAPGHGTVTVSGGSLLYTPALGFAGTDTFTYTIEDPGHLTGTAVVTVTVQNANPIAVPDTAVAKAGSSVVVKVLANDTDPNLGQVLRVLSVTKPAHGTATVNPDGTVTYRSDPGSTGTDTFDYVVTDDQGGTDVGSVTVTIDAPPVATPDKATTKPGAATVIDVLGNDTDSKGSALTLVSVTAPKHGTVKIVNGKVSYTPDAGYAGPDTFTYLVRDADGGESTGQVSVDVANADPVAVTDRAAVIKNGRADIDVLANDTDVNTGQKLTVTSVGPPAHGKATVTADGRIRYVPDAGFTGTDTFTYVISDGNGGSATATVSVTVTDSAPVALPDERTTAYEQAVRIKVLGNDMDPNGDPLTVVGVTQPEHGTVTFTGTSVKYTPPKGWSGTASFTYTISDGSTTSTSTVTVTVGAPPAVPDKTATALPSTPVKIDLPTVDKHNTEVTVVRIGKPAHGTAKLNADGTVTYTPDDGFAGADSFSYSAVDAYGNIASGTVKVTVTGPNAAPKAKDDAAAVKAGKSVVIKVRDNDKDPNEDPLTVVKVSKPRHGNAVVNADGTITYAPDDAYLGGKDTFTYTVSDGRGGTDTATVTVSVHQAGSQNTDGGFRLPKTGADIASVGGVGILTLIVGAALFFFGDRNQGPGRHRPGRHAGSR